MYAEIKQYEIISLWLMKEFIIKYDSGIVVVPE